MNEWVIPLFVGGVLFGLVVLAALLSGGPLRSQLATTQKLSVRLEELEAKRLDDSRRYWDTEDKLYKQAQEIRYLQSAVIDGVKIIRWYGEVVRDCVGASVSSPPINIEEWVRVHEQRASVFSEYHHEIEITAETRFELWRLIGGSFSEEDVKTLAFALRIEYESLGAVGKDGRIRELIKEAERQQRVRLLVEWCREMRPNVDWPTQV